MIYAVIVLALLTVLAATDSGGHDDHGEPHSQN